MGSILRKAKQLLARGTKIGEDIPRLQKCPRFADMPQVTDIPGVVAETMFSFPFLLLVVVTGVVYFR